MKSFWLSILEGVSEGRRLRIFIIPTWYCLLFNLFVLVMLAYGFGNRSVSVMSAGFLVLFIEILSMIESHVNVRELEVEADDCPPVVEGGCGKLKLGITSKTQSFGLRCYLVEPTSPIRWFSLRSRGVMQPYALKELAAAWKFWQLSDGPSVEDDFNCGQTPYFVSLNFTAGSRGIHLIPKIVVSSMFPFGMFRVWREFNLNETYAAYPTPSGVSFQERTVAEQNLEAAIASGRASLATETEYLKHQELKAGDSPRRIDWKASSRRGVKMVRVFTGENSDVRRVISWDETRGLAPEKRLQQLSRWVHEAHDNHVLYRLVLPSVESAFGSGDAHKSFCLKLLASVALPSVDGAEAT